MDLILEFVDELSHMPRWQAWIEAEKKFGVKKTYHAYLQSPEWKEKRKEITKGKKCGCCGKRDAYQVHHMSYRYKYAEPLFDLVPVCDPCHEALTAIDNVRGMLAAAMEQTDVVENAPDGRPDFIGRRVG